MTDMNAIDSWDLYKCRDYIAERQGWKWFAAGRSWLPPRATENDARSMMAGVLPAYDHPVPATLDSIAASLPEGNRYWWEINQYPSHWRAQVAYTDPDEGEAVFFVSDGPTELLSRARACCKAWAAKDATT